MAGFLPIPDSTGVLLLKVITLLGATGWGWLASLKGHTLNLEVTIRRHVVDGLHVEAVGEFEFMPVWQLDGQVSLVKGDAHLRDAPRLEREGSLPLFCSPGPIVLAVTHNGVGISVGVEAGVEV